VNCRRASHLISALIDGELCGAEALRLREHIEQCPVCRADYETLRETKQLLSGMAVVEPRPGFEQDLLNYVLSAPCEPAWKRAIVGWWQTTDRRNRMRAAAAFAALSLAVLALSVRGTLQTASSALPSYERLSMANGAWASPLPGRDVGFVHETVDRPQPVRYQPSQGLCGADSRPDIRTISPWHTYLPVSSAP